MSPENWELPNNTPDMSSPADILSDLFPKVRLQSSKDNPFEEALSDSGHPLETFWKSWADSQGYDYRPLVKLEELSPDLIPSVPISFAKAHLVLPLERRVRETSDNGPATLRVLCGSPSSFRALGALSRILFGDAADSFSIEPVLMPQSALYSLINNAYERYAQTETTRILDSAEEESDSFSDLLSIQETVDLLDAKDEAPIIRLANSILSQAVRQKASDIHLEPFEEEVKVRYRLDGVLYNVLSIPQKLKAGIISRFKLMANLNIAEKRLPQDGRLRVIVAGRDVDIRVSIIPTFFGERVVLRLLDKQRGVISLANIGLSPENEAAMERLLSRSNGIILVTGPTGSGKTTTLYAALNRINTPEKNIITIEDPIEYQLKGIGQIQVNPKIDLTFAGGLRSILRQDPDIIMVGEIRDAETAEIAMQASLTGHLVLSTLHTNDAATAVTRLIDMGVEPFMVASSLSAVMAQRLVRVICPHCKEEYTPEREYAGIKLPPKLYRGRGCDKCFNLGTTGRIGIYEFLLIDSELCSMIIRQAPAGVIKEYAISRGMRTLREDGLAKAAAGITTIEEVLRVTQEDYADLPL